MKKILQTVLTALTIFSATAEPVMATTVIHNWDTLAPVTKEAKYKTRDQGPTLIFSDSPEMVNKIGVMYQDTVQGDVRLFFHHVNDTSTTKKLSIMLHNPTLKTLELNLGQRGISKPSRDWLKAGQDVQIAYFNKQKTETITLEPFETLELLSRKSGLNFKPQQLVTGMVDIKSTGTLEVTFLMSTPGSNIFVDKEILPKLPPDQHPPLRGTFPNATRYINVIDDYKVGTTPLALTLADGVIDKFLWGTDALTGKPAHNYGNYGVLYEVSYKTTAQPYQLGFNTLGGPLAGVGLLKMQGQYKHTMLPPHGLYMGQTEKETLLFNMTDEDYSGSFIFSPPGSSNLPIRLLLKGYDTPIPKQ